MFVLENREAIRRVVHEAKQAGEDPARIVVYIGDVRRKDFMQDYRRLHRNNPNLESTLREIRKVKDAVLCTYIGREDLMKALATAGSPTAGILDRPAPEGSTWVYAISMKGPVLMMIPLEDRTTIEA